MQEFYVIVKYESTWESIWTPHILCEDGTFQRPRDIMGTTLYIPVFFNSKESAKQAKKVYGHWPKYKVIKIEDPSWLN